MATPTTISSRSANAAATSGSGDASDGGANHPARCFKKPARLRSPEPGQSFMCSEHAPHVERRFSFPGDELAPPGRWRCQGKPDQDCGADDGEDGIHGNTPRKGERGCPDLGSPARGGGKATSGMETWLGRKEPDAWLAASGARWAIEGISTPVVFEVRSRRKVSAGASRQANWRGLIMY